MKKRRLIILYLLMVFIIQNIFGRDYTKSDVDSLASISFHSKEDIKTNYQNIYKKVKNDTLRAINRKG